MDSHSQQITPFLWFDTQAREAAEFYTFIFKNSKIDATTYYGENGPGPAGSVMTVAFDLNGQRFTALNGGPHYKFNEAVSFVVMCDTQEEVDEYWTQLTDGGNEVACGWLKDKYGLSWQIVPSRFIQMMQDKDPTRQGRVMAAMMKMKKLDLPELERAFEG